MHSHDIWHLEHDAQPPDPGRREDVERLVDVDEVIAATEDLMLQPGLDEHPLEPYVRWRLGYPPDHRALLHAGRPSGPTAPCPHCQGPTPHDPRTASPACAALVISELQEALSRTRAELLLQRASTYYTELVERAIDRCVERALRREDTGA